MFGVTIDYRCVMMRIFLVFTLLIPTLIYGADHELFKDCARVDFCNQLRNRTNRNLFNYVGFLDEPDIGLVKIYLGKPINETDDYTIVIDIDAMSNDDTFRVRIREEVTTRYELDYVLNENLHTKPLDDSIWGPGELEFISGQNSIIYTMETQELKFLQNEIELVVLKGDTLYLEDVNISEAYAFEIQFPQSVQAYGIHEHADHIALQNTGPGGVDPYRLKNVDIAGYELNSTMANYGAIPVIYGHGPNHTAGFFLHNAAEQWYDINNSENEGTNVFVMGESGTLDLFILMGNTPEKVVRQYVNLTGTAHLPQLWALGYHQSRWNYESQDDVKEVIANFEQFDFPLDVIWLDIEYTDGKKYFTWNSTAFSDPVGMQDAIAAVHKKLVTIIDPHLKVDADYPVYTGALENDLFVKYANGTVFEGNCWPGLSSYMDFLNPAARDYYAEQYSFEKFNGTTPTLAGIWNDMNEPSVFDDIDRAEKTIPGDALHFNGVRHKDVHNIYGFLHTMSTHQGLMARDEGKKRPFILSRSTFAGSQRVAAFWTGDNSADWGYLAVSYSECLNANILGYVFCGADVGGFAGDPDEELLQRWYQAGAWLPFYRAHANMGTKRREPYLFSDEVQTVIRNAIKLRYQHIPVWYTLFYEHTRNGDPIIRPLFYQYPQDISNFAIDDQLLVGKNILVKAVSSPGVDSVDVYFPGGNEELWLSLDTKEVFTGDGYKTIPVDLQNIPIYYRAGSIIATKVSDKLNTEEMVDVDYTLIVNLDKDNKAEGTLYLDDNTSFNYRDNKEYLYVNLVYQPSDENVTIVKIDDSNSTGFEITIGQIIVNSVTKLPDGKSNPGIYTQKIINTDLKFQVN